MMSGKDVGKLGSHRLAQLMVTAEDLGKAIDGMDNALGRLRDALKRMSEHGILSVKIAKSDLLITGVTSLITLSARILGEVDTIAFNTALGPDAKAKRKAKESKTK